MTITGRIASANLRDLFVCETCRGILGASIKAFWVRPRAILIAEGLSILCDLIGNVVGLRAKEKMIGPDASAVITVMQNEGVFGNDSVIHLPGKAVCQHRCSSTAFETSVASGFEDGTSPLPAAVWLPFYKSFKALFGSQVPSAIVRAETATALGHARWRGRKSLATSFTDAGNHHSHFTMLYSSCTS